MQFGTNPFRHTHGNVSIEVRPNLSTRQRDRVEVLNGIATFGLGDIVEAHLVLLAHGFSEFYARASGGDRRNRRNPECSVARRLRVPLTQRVPLWASERQSGWVLGPTPHLHAGHARTHGWGDEHEVHALKGSNPHNASGQNCTLPFRMLRYTLGEKDASFSPIAN